MHFEKENKKLYLGLAHIAIMLPTCESWKGHERNVAGIKEAWKSDFDAIYDGIVMHDFKMVLSVAIKDEREVSRMKEG